MSNRWIRVLMIGTALALMAGGCGDDDAENPESLEQTGETNDSEPDDEDDGTAEESDDDGSTAGEEEEGEDEEEEDVEMPDLVDLTEDDAFDELIGLGVDDADIQVEERESMEDPGTVIDQLPRAGSPISGSINLVIAVPVPEVPDFVGADLSEVAEWAEERGISVVVTEVLDDSVPQDQVLATTPAAGDAPSSDLAVDVAVPPVTELMASSEPVNSSGTHQTGVAEVGGDTYPDSLLAYVGDGCCDLLSTVEYNLSRDWTRFQAVVGLSDDAPSAASVKITILLDGEEVFNETLSLGTVRDLDIDVADALRVVFTVENVADSSDEVTEAWVVFGDARVTAPPDAGSESGSSESSPEETDKE